MMKNIAAVSSLSITTMLGLAGFALAQDVKPAEPPLTPQEQAEKAVRDQCKNSICEVFTSKNVEGTDIACDLTKTVRKDKIEQEYLGNKFSWPWGNARCKANVNIKREMLVKAATVDGYVSTLPKNALSCELFKGEGGEKYEMSLTVAPKVTWKGGKADSVELNIADIDGAALAQGGIWTIAKANSYFGVLDEPVKNKLNELVTQWCAGIKD